MSEITHVYKKSAILAVATVAAATLLGVIGVAIGL